MSIKTDKSNGFTLTSQDFNGPQMPGLNSSQSGGSLEIGVKLSSSPDPGQQNFSSAQSDPVVVSFNLTFNWLGLNPVVLLELLEEEGFKDLVEDLKFALLDSKFSREFYNDTPSHQICSVYPGPLLLLLWSTSPNLWLSLSSLALLVSDDPSTLLSLPGNFLTSGEVIVKSLTCDSLDLCSTKSSFSIPSPEIHPLSPLLVQEGTDSVPLQEMEILPFIPSCAPWLVAGVMLMGSNSYFPQLNQYPSSGLLSEQPSQ
ncbi:hypothetical protein DSO57_1016035 [Entomophthora muscae]|uniref:Uncharacterized protein n=1 Tax=Entomophthora muscae TaxID=34485 RepID=A0ACC2UEB6_9FUNG|nr:hypothetical protein DSO57_1016035 [Entomophthora muscae]